MDDKHAYVEAPHCLDDVFDSNNERRLWRAFRGDDDVHRAFRKAASAYHEQAERLRDPKHMGPSAAQAARGAFLDALDLQVKVQE